MFTDKAIEAAKPLVLARLLAEGFVGAEITGAARVDDDPESAWFYWVWDHPKGPQNRQRAFHMDDFAG